MSLEIDVLITYSDRDNEIPPGAQTGWVTQFRKFLDLMLSQILSSRPNILLKGEYDSLTSPNLNNAATLVCILSPNFVQSGYCLGNMDAFYKAAEDAGKTRNRIFKAFKSPVSLQHQPPRLREFPGYEMYHLETDTGEVREYTDYLSSEAERQYWMKMVDLAYDIADTLSELKGGEKAEVKNIFRRKTIYLAETSYDLSVQRSIIKRELQRHGYVVTPSQTLPGNLPDVERIVRKHLEEASVSIHLIGSTYGEIPEGADRSIVELQNRYASEKSQVTRKEDFTRLIWISPASAKANEQQRTYIDHLKRETEAQENAEILETPLEDFKNIIREELIEAPERKKPDEADGRSIYLVHDRIDQTEVRPLIEAIERNGYKVLVPAFEGEILDVRQQHIENLKNFDAAIIYKGKVNDQWVRMKVLDLQKAPGFGRKKPIIGKAVIAAPDTKLDRDSFHARDVRFVLADPNDTEQTVKLLLEEFNS